MAATKPSVKEAQQLTTTDPRKAEAIYKEIISKPPSVTSDAAVKEYESALISLGELYRDEKSVVPSISCIAYLPTHLSTKAGECE